MGSGDDEWELDEGIPQFGDPFIQKYINGREALIQEERKQRHGSFDPYLSSLGKIEVNMI